MNNNSEYQDEEDEAKSIEARQEWTQPKVKAAIVALDELREALINNLKYCDEDSAEEYAYDDLQASVNNLVGELKNYFPDAVTESGNQTNV